MSVVIKTKTPRSLVRRIKESIDRGIISSWRYDSDGDFTLQREDLSNLAWMQPLVTIPKEELVMAKIGRVYAPVTTTQYAKYHALFTELILQYFDEDVTDISVTPQPTKYDRLNPDTEP